MICIAPRVGAFLLLSTTLAHAGGLDRSGQPIAALFEQGRYAELSFGHTTPTVEGTFTLAGPAIGSGNAGVPFSQVGAAYKYDIDDRLSFALILDQPFGADVDYDETDAGYPLDGSEAHFDSRAITAAGRYKFGNGFGAHAGLRLVEVDADLRVVFDQGIVSNTYDAEFEPDLALGYVVGASYEREAIGLRVALTYSSETEFSHRTDFTNTLVINGVPIPSAGTGVTEYTMPQSVNLDVRTGIAADTLLFGSVRWVDWSSTEINVPGPYPDNPVVSYEEDIVTYTLGIGRQVTDRLAASAAVIYEPATGSDFDPTVPGSGASNLAPTSGQLGLQVAGTYDVAENLELTGVVRYTKLGDVTTRGIGSEFEGSDALTLGLRVGYRF